ncbi:MAG: ABC transporter permease [Acidobacteria bacterium]|nr:ABC transporter permease [Acidobacteriota bacterium]
MPDWKAYVRRNLRLVNLRPEREGEIVEDLAQQFEDAYRDALLRGLSEEHAELAARQHICDWNSFSDQLSHSQKDALDAISRLQNRVNERGYRHGQTSQLARAPQDILFALRMMRKSPVFTSVVVLTLALGIGANTAIFSVLNALLLHAVPARNPQELVSLRWSAQPRLHLFSHSNYGDCQGERLSTRSAASSCSFSLPFFRKLQRQADGPFAGLAAFADAPRLDLSGNGIAAIVKGELVSGDYFSTLGVQPIAGRLLSTNDENPHPANVVVLSHSYWQSAFGGAQSAVGKVIRLNSVSFTIVGVVEPGFKNLAMTQPNDLWLPLDANPQVTTNYDPREAEADSFWVEIVGRLRNGVSSRRAEAAIALQFRNEVLHGDKPVAKESDQIALHLAPVAKALGPSSDKLQPVYVLTLAVALILLIACANVAGLLLARAMARRKEIAVRAAIGAARRHLVAQLLTESVLLSALGGAVGVLFAMWALHAIMDMVSNGGEMPIPFAASIDLRVLLFTGSISILTGIVFGTIPALRATRVDLNTAMKGDETTTGRKRWFSAGNLLVGVQVSLAIVLLVGAGMLVRTLRKLEMVNPGFDTNNLLLFGVNAQLAGYSNERVDSLYQDLRERLASIPGVTNVSYSWRPLLRGSLWTTDIHLPGTAADAHVEVDRMAVGPDFFATLGIPFLRGRDFTETDFASARSLSLYLLQHRHETPPTEPMPAIVNQKFVEECLKGGSALGQQFGYENQADRKNIGYEVLGVVADAKYNSLRRDIKPTVYLPSAAAAVYFEMRTALPPESLIPQVRSTVGSVNDALPLFDIKTQQQQIDEQLMTERTLARVSAFFGLAALLLASMGLYGLLAYEVVRRTREVGLRMALGASRSRVVRSVVQRGLSLAVAGALAGATAALALLRLARALLYGIDLIDPATLVAVSALLIAVALAACILPAWRAAKVDPIVSLRCE